MDFNLSQVVHAVADTIGDREAIVDANRRYTYRQFMDRCDRLSAYFVSEGLGAHSERSSLQGHESGQDHLAIYMHNCIEYIEAMMGAYGARIAPFNVNYRYVADELRYLLNDSKATAIVYHSAFAPLLDEVRSELPNLRVLLQVPDDSGNALLDGARWYEDATSNAPEVELPTPSPDDLYILYTGGTTGMPKGVLWRQGDIYPGALGGRKISTGIEYADLAEICENAAAGGMKVFPAAPFMHGAAHWMAINALGNGNTIVLPEQTKSFDPVDACNTIQKEGVNLMLIVGDAFGRPLLDEIKTGKYDLSSLMLLISGGAALSAPVKAAILEALPSVAIMDGLGSSETGQQASQVIGAGAPVTTGTFNPGTGMAIVSEDFDRVLEAGHEEPGWLAQRGRVPLGYLGDAEKTARTFPTINGERFSVPGDRARLRADNVLELFGRDSVTINSGGEKIFAEEVEAAIAHHPAVYDVIVAGRSSERWGNEVVAIVRLRDGQTATADELLSEAGQHIARYKLPKEIIFTDTIVRSPAGKADYRWARSVAEGN